MQGIINFLFKIGHPDQTVIMVCNFCKLNTWRRGLLGHNLLFFALYICDFVL